MDLQHNFPFSASSKHHDLEELLRIRGPEEPAGFKAFWEENYALVTAMRPTYFIEREVWSPYPDVRIYRIRVKNWDNTEFVMFIARPDQSRGGLLIGQEYGHFVLPQFRSGFTTGFACVRGLGLSSCKEIPWDAERHIVHGIRMKETYILRGAVADQWMAAGVLLDMFPDTAENLNYSGCGMGGGMGALLLPWDKRFRAAFLALPSFGAEIRFDRPSSGSEEACRQYLAGHPPARKVLAWFDASAAAKYIRIPVGISLAVSDPCVAPAGQFSIANAVPDAYKTLFIRETGHCPPAEHDLRLERQADEWCEKLFSAGK